MATAGKGKAKKESVMSVTVLFFGHAKQKTGKDSALFHIAKNESIKTFREKLLQEFPELAGLKSSLAFSINCEWAQENDRLNTKDEIGVIPPVSGG